VDARARERRIGVKQLTGSLPAGAIVVAVVRARQSQELVDQRLLVDDRVPDRLLVG
jgi:hypothetical protein